VIYAVVNGTVILKWTLKVRMDVVWTHLAQGMKRWRVAMNEVNDGLKIR
jgi:hypothetical protein